jgi:hypothetical protein
MAVNSLAVRFGSSSSRHTIDREFTKLSTSHRLSQKYINGDDNRTHSNDDNDSQSYNDNESYDYNPIPSHINDKYSSSNRAHSNHRNNKDNSDSDYSNHERSDSKTRPRRNDDPYRYLIYTYTYT